MEILLINSDEPLVQALKITLLLNWLLPRRRMLLFSRLKYTRGTAPPTTWLSAVAAAAPDSLYSCGSRITRTASRTMLVRPDSTVTASPSFGLSAVTQNDWNKS